MTEDKLQREYPGLSRHNSYKSFSKSLNAGSYRRDLRQRKNRRTVTNCNLPAIYTYHGYMLRFYIYYDKIGSKKDAYLKVEDELQATYPGLYRYSCYNAFRNAIQELRRKAKVI